MRTTATRGMTVKGNSIPASQLIAWLQESVAEFGDLPVTVMTETEDRQTEQPLGDVAVCTSEKHRRIIICAEGA